MMVKLSSKFAAFAVIVLSVFQRHLFASNAIAGTNNATTIRTRIVVLNGKALANPTVTFDTPWQRSNGNFSISNNNAVDFQVNNSHSDDGELAELLNRKHPLAKLRECNKKLRNTARHKDAIKNCRKTLNDVIRRKRATRSPRIESRAIEPFFETVQATLNVLKRFIGNVNVLKFPEKYGTMEVMKNDVISLAKKFHSQIDLLGKFARNNSTFAVPLAEFEKLTNAFDRLKSPTNLTRKVRGVDSVYGIVGEAYTCVMKIITCIVNFIGDFFVKKP